MRQSYTINARHVHVDNRRSPKSTPRVRSLADAAVKLAGKQPDRRPDAVEMDVEKVKVVGAVEPRDLPRGVGQDALDLLEQVAHESSPLSDDARNRPPASTPSTVGETASISDPPIALATVPAPSPHGAGTPKPYYQDDLVTLYCGDSLRLADVWRGLDVMITDPPYGLQGIAGAYGTGHRTIANDMDTVTRDIVLDLWGDKPIAVFGSPRMEDPPGDWDNRLVWDKGQLGLNGGPWRYAHESIFVRGDGWVRVDNSASSVMRYPSQANRKHVADHIHSKPLQLLAKLVAAAPAGMIVDPFAGGGSTVAAAVMLGRPIVAIELEEHNCDLIINRIQQHTLDIPAAPRATYVPPTLDLGGE